VGGRDTLVAIFLRGGADGLTLCAPWSDPHYQSARPTLAVAAPDAAAPNRGVALDDRFAFPAAMAPLLPAYRARDLLIVHAAGQMDGSRSHFDAQRFMEVGKAADPSIDSGWLARHLATAPPVRDGALLRGVGVSPGMPKILNGAPRTLPIADLAEEGFGGSPESLDARLAFLRTVYAAEPDPLRSLALNAIDTRVLLTSLGIRRYRPADGVSYPDTALAASLRSIAAIIKSDAGLEVAHVDLGGWDTHARQDPHAGSMFSTMSTFAQAVAAFHADVIARDHPVTLVAISEFGRHVEENASLGTDHGRGTVMFAMGRHIAGGRVLVNRWPGLAPEEQDDHALRVTIDYRDILAEIVERRLGNGNLAAVFPGLVPTPWGVTR
jgi:uncharacterized protein (DUF1501 family)